MHLIEIKIIVQHVMLKLVITLITNIAFDP